MRGSRDAGKVSRMTYRNRFLRDCAASERWTPADAGIAACLLDAMDTKQTARAMGLSPSMVGLYRLRLKRRMKAKNLVHLALKLAEIARAPEVAA